MNDRLIYTKNCILCGSPNIVIAGGHVIRDTFGAPNLHIIPCYCEECRNSYEKYKLLNNNGYYGKYEEEMGMCDNPFLKTASKKQKFAEILSLDIAKDFGLTYRCAVNLEETINNMLLDGVSEQNIKSYLYDIYENYEQIV